MCKIWMAKISLNRDLKGFNGFIGNGTQKNSSYQSNNLPYPNSDEKGPQRIESLFSSRLLRDSNFNRVELYD
jgi:hypothetical protein